MADYINNFKELNAKHKADHDAWRRLLGVISEYLRKNFTDLPIVFGPRDPSSTVVNLIWIDYAYVWEFTFQRDRKSYVQSIDKDNNFRFGYIELSSDKITTPIGECGFDSEGVEKAFFTLIGLIKAS